jgi:hypothetical protein
VKLSGSHNILSNISEYPTVLTLEALDGGTQHAITVVGKLIFDSNCERALPLNMNSLDYCCSTDKLKGTFYRVFKGYRFMEPIEKKHKVLDLLKKKYNINFYLEDDQHLDSI